MAMQPSLTNRWRPFFFAAFALVVAMSSAFVTINVNSSTLCDLGDRELPSCQ